MYLSRMANAWVESQPLWAPAAPAHCWWRPWPPAVLCQMGDTHCPVRHITLVTSRTRHAVHPQQTCMPQETLLPVYITFLNMPKH